MADLAGRWSGIALAAGAILLGVGLLMASFSPASAPPSQRTSAFLLISTILVMLALPAVYARQANAAGLLGLLAHILLEVGLVFLLVYAAAPLLYRSLNEPPGEGPIALFLGTALVVGLLLTSIVTIRAAVFPRWSGILLLGATIGFFFDFFIAEFLPPIAGQIGAAFFGAVVSAALAWMGISMWIQ